MSKPTKAELIERLRKAFKTFPIIEEYHLLEDRLEAAEQATERAMRYAFEAGYGSGHNDTVEGMFSLDEETMSEEWLADIKSDGTFKAIIGVSHE